MKRYTMTILIILFVSSFFFILNCGNDGGSSSPTPGDSTTPTATVIPANGSVINTSQKIVITFSESINISSLILGGIMEPESDSGTWSSNNSTLTISPNTSWTDGIGRTLTIDCNDLAGNSADTISLTFDVDATAPTIIIASPANKSTILSSQMIVITFSESMDTGMLTLGGDMASESDGGIWSHGTLDNDTLTINPGTEWTAGEGRTLTIDCSDVVGNQLVTLSVSYIVLDVEGIIYVSDANGNDGYSGSIGEPKQTIQAGIDEADTLYSIGAVLVAEGTYSKDYNTDGDSVVMLEEGVSIYGGYSNDYTERDTALHKTFIGDTSTAGGSGANPNRAVFGGTGITNTTVIDGFTITGGGGDFSSAIFNESGSSPAITNNTIDGGSGNYSYGIMNFSSSPIIQKNTIYGGNSNNFSYAIYNNSSSPEILNNIINGGYNSGYSGSFSYGIYNQSSSSSTIRNNTIDGGSGSTLSYGIVNSSSSPKIQNNTIYGGNSNNSYGINNFSSSSPVIQNNTIDGGTLLNSIGINNKSSDEFNYPSVTIENNIIFSSGGTNRIGIYEEDEYADPASVRNNDIFMCPTGLYRDFDTGYDMQGVNGSGNFTENSDGSGTELATPTASGNISEVLSLDSEFRFTGDLDLVDFDTAGLNGAHSSENWDYTTDKDGDPRSPLDDSSATGWSIGAYEYD